MNDDIQSTARWIFKSWKNNDMVDCAYEISVLYSSVDYNKIREVMTELKRLIEEGQA